MARVVRREEATTVEWQVTIDGGNEILGPFTEEELVDTIAKGMTTTALVRPMGRANWKRIDAHAPFAEALRKAQLARLLAPSSGPAAAPPPSARALAPAVTSSPDPREPAGENTLLDEDGVTITNARVVILGTTYVLANITSVRSIGEDRPAGLLRLWIALVAIGLLAIYWSFVAFGAIFLVLGAGLAAIYFLVTKPKFWVQIGTAGAETRAIFFFEEARTMRVVDALNAAIVLRG